MGRPSTVLSLSLSRLLTHSCRVVGCLQVTSEEVAIKRVNANGNKHVDGLVKVEMAIQQKLNSDYIAQLLAVFKKKVRDVAHTHTASTPPHGPTTARPWQCQ